MGRASVPTPAVYPAFFFVLEKGSKSAGNAVIPTFPAHCPHGLQHLRHKRPTFAFTSESGYTLGFRRRIAHKGSHGETRGVSDGGAITTRFGNPAWPGGRTANFAAFGSWSGVLPKNAESLRNSSCASLFRRRRGPAGPRDLFTFVEIAACMPCSRYFFRFSRRSSLCRSCASCVSARFFSARSSMVFGRNRQDFLL